MRSDVLSMFAINAWFVQVFTGLGTNHDIELRDSPVTEDPHSSPASGKSFGG